MKPIRFTKEALDYMIMQMSKECPYEFMKLAKEEETIHPPLESSFYTDFKLSEPKAIEDRIAFDISATYIRPANFINVNLVVS